MEGLIWLFKQKHERFSKQSGNRNMKNRQITRQIKEKEWRGRSLSHTRSWWWQSL